MEASRRIQDRSREIRIRATGNRQHARVGRTATGPEGRAGTASSAACREVERQAVLADPYLQPAVWGEPRSVARIRQERKRRTAVVRIFPNRAACLRLVTVLCMEQSEEWLSGRRYLDMGDLVAPEHHEGVPGE